MKTIIPNLFIVGAPRAGTTTIYNWLNMHPQVNMSKIKEPAYFTHFKNITWGGPRSENLNKQFKFTKEEYLSLFENGKYKYWGEASSDYLWTKESSTNIYTFTKKYNCSPKIIISLRNPVERAYSEYIFNRMRGVEDLSFEDAIKEEKIRMQKKFNPLFYHVARGLYYEGVKRFIDTFGKENVLILEFNEIISNSYKTYSNICEFLQIEPHPINTNLVHNRSGIIRSNYFQKYVIGNSFFARYINRFIPTSLKTQVKNWNLKKYPKLSESDKARLFLFFKEDIEKLESLLSKSLNSFKPQDIGQDN